MYIHMCVYIYICVLGVRDLRHHVLRAPRGHPDRAQGPYIYIYIYIYHIYTMYIYIYIYM